jgi:hypothetical protein
VPFAENVIAELSRKIVAGSAPSPSTLMALWNQITLPSAIAVGLKLNSIELLSVHEPAAGLTADGPSVRSPEDELSVPLANDEAPFGSAEDEETDEERPTATPAERIKENF